MSFTKLGEALDFDLQRDLLSPKEALPNDEIANRFIKMAKKLKRLAPKASGFLYGHCIMMHAAEASLVDQKTGSPILGSNGKPITAIFESFKTKNGKESVRWKCSKEDIMPYKNANGDIFPESELLKAHKHWIEKPLCKDHKSESVDGIRGIIIDTYYDPRFKRVHALFALDKTNYADLARKVETGYANAVSMGTAVGRSVCTTCGNVATAERDYCDCIKARSNYGEINLDLNPLELSLVVNGADHLAKIQNIIASVNNYVQKKQARIDQLVNDRCVNPTELQSLADSVNEIQAKLNSLMSLQKTASTKNAAEMGEISKAIEVLQEQVDLETDPEKQTKLRQKIDELVDDLEVTPKGNERTPTEESSPEHNLYWPQATGGGSEPSFSTMSDQDTAAPAPGSFDPTARFAGNDIEGVKQGTEELTLLRSKVADLQKSISDMQDKLSQGESNTMNSARLRTRAKARRAYWLGGGGVNEPTPGKAKYEKDPMAEEVRNKEDKQMTGVVETGSDGLYPGDEEKLRGVNRGGFNLSKAELEDRKMKRRAYWMGGGGINEPTPGKQKYDKDPMAEKVRNTEDKQMLQTMDMGGTDGSFPGDVETKKRINRAGLKARFTKVADSKGQLNKSASHWDVFADDQMILSATGSEIFGDQMSDEDWSYLSDKSGQYGKDVMAHIRTEGFERVAYLLKGAVPAAPADPMAGMGAPGAMPPAAPDMGAPPAPDMGAPPAPDAGALPPPGGDKKVDMKEPKDDTQKKIDEALSTVEEKIEEIRELSTGQSKEGLVDIDVNVDKKDKGDDAGGKLDELGASANEELMTVLALMDESADELAMASEALEKNASARVVEAATAALQDNAVIMAQAAIVVDAKKKSKKDKKENPFAKKDKEDAKENKEDAKENKEDKDKNKEDKKDNKEDKKKEDAKEKKEDEKEAKAQRLLDSALKIRAANRTAMLDKVAAPLAPTNPDPQHFDLTCKTCGRNKDGGCPHAEDGAMAMDPGCAGQDCLEVTETLGDVKASRRLERERLVAEAADKILGKYELTLDTATNVTEPKYFEAHPGGKGTTTKLDTKPEGDGAKVETISEIHDAMREVAEKSQTKVREAAAVLQEMVVEGKIKAEDIDSLVAEGKVDSAAASYWKKFFAQFPGAGSFGSDLSKEFATGKKEASDESYKIKLRRAYDIGLQAQDKGIIGSTRPALDKYVDEVMHFDDASFESVKRAIGMMAGSKKSGAMPRVGTDGPATEAMVSTASTETQTNMADQLSGLFMRK